MNPIKQLAGQTAIYGLSTIIGRFLNYLLVPIYLRKILPGDYGIVTEMYAYVGFFIIIYLYGMETTFFRFAQDDKKKNQIYSTSFLSVFLTSILLSGLMILFKNPLANLIQYPDQSKYIWWFALILAFDAITAIPFAKLRLENKAITFAVLKLINIFINIGLNLFFIVLCPVALAGEYQWLLPLVEKVYNPEANFEYIFIANLLANGLTFLLLFPFFPRKNLTFDKILWKQMLAYARPLLWVGLAGMTNELIDRIMLKNILNLPQNQILEQVGIYGAVYKIAILMGLFNQTFRMGAEPFFFDQSKKDNARQTYADVMRLFVALASLVFVWMMLFLETDVIALRKFTISGLVIGDKHEAYYSGLIVVPILFMARLFFGIYYNLSVWYKLTDNTKFGMYIAFIGAGITIIGNYFLIPILGFLGSAWTTLFCFIIMTLISYFLGRKYYPIPYPIARILFYVFSALGIFLFHEFLFGLLLPSSPLWVFGIKISLAILYLCLIFKLEKRALLAIRKK